MSEITTKPFPAPVPTPLAKHEARLIGLLGVRTDIQIILNAYKNMCKRHEQTEAAFRKFKKSTPNKSFELGADICIATRALWLAIYTMADLYRPALSAPVIAILKKAFQEALKLSKTIIIKVQWNDLTPVMQETSKEKFALAIAARRDSMDALNRHEPLHEFSRIGIMSSDSEEIRSPEVAKASKASIAANKKPKVRATLVDIAPRQTKFGGLTKDSYRANSQPAIKAQAPRESETATTVGNRGKSSIHSHQKPKQKTAAAKS